MSGDGAGPGVWSLVEDRAGTPPGATDVWSMVAERTDPTRWRPRLAPDIEIKEFRLRSGNDYVMIANPRDLIHYRLTPDEAELARRMDGTRTVAEIVLDRFRESGGLELDVVMDLVRELRVGNFFDEPYVDVPQIVQGALHPISRARERGRRFLRTLSIDWAGAEGFVRWIYRRGLRWFFTRWAQLPMAIAAVGGLIAFGLIVRSGRFELAGSTAASASLILLALNYFLTFIHELGHSAVLIHYGRRIKNAGFMIYFGSPAFFVEASDGLMLERRERILQAFAGPYAELVVAGAASLLAWVFPDAAMSQILYTFAVLNYLILFLNLIPLLELDGYWILSDLIQVPDLRPRSLGFIRHDLWHRIRERQRLTLQETGLAAYGILGVAFTVFSFYTAFFFWREIFGGLVSDMWNGGPILRLLLVVLAVFVAGPAIRGLIDLARSLFRRARAVARRIRFRLERGWRVELAELIDGLPLFDDLPVDVLNELAGRARLRSLARGQPVFRQGARPDAFYVVRRGVLRVVEEDPESGTERALRSLARGEAFGELGLAEGRPRTATVRALEDAEVFEIDRGTFERLLLDRATVPRFAPTLQAIVELRELPPFAHLGADQLAELLDRGGWVRFAPGERILVQGEPGDAFYAISSGHVDVTQDGKPIRTLGPGDHFGEIALLLDVPRTASVVARTPMRAYRLDRTGFDRVLSASFRRGTLRPHIAIDRTWHH